MLIVEGGDLANGIRDGQEPKAGVISEGQCIAHWVYDLREKPMGGDEAGPAAVRIAIRAVKNPPGAVRMKQVEAVAGTASAENGVVVLLGDINSGLATTAERA